MEASDDSKEGGDGDGGCDGGGDGEGKLKNYHSAADDHNDIIKLR